MLFFIVDIKSSIPKAAIYAAVVSPAPLAFIVLKSGGTISIVPSRLINLAGKFLSKASLPLSILTPTRLGSSEITEEDRQSMMMNNNMSLGIMNPELLNQFDNITNTGVNQRPEFIDRIKGGIETMRDKLGPIGDFFSKGGVMGNVISALGKRGDESTRGIAGLNLQDVFNA